MSRDPRRPYPGVQHRDRARERPVWGRSDYPKRSPVARKRSRSRSPPMRSVPDGGRRSPRRNDKDMLDENILSEIAKLPEPSELWEGQPAQHQESNFPGALPPPPFQAEASNSSYPGYQPSYSGIYDDFPSAPPTQIPPEIASWNQMSLPPPPGPPAPVFVNNIEDQIKKEAAIESEMRHQKAALSKQREDYIKKAGILKKELDTLKDQRSELRGDAKRSPSPDTKRFLKENTKLQLEIQNKLKTINNVVDMLNGIIGEEAQEVVESDDSERNSKRKSRSPSGKKSNYVYYDPEMHWCRVCNEFPPTAKDYLNHLHSPAHHKMAAAHMEAPWHSVSGVNEGFPSYPSAPTKRTPIRGLQFFVPSTAWYCKLCDQFIGDLHCASAHLKSIVHSKNYTNFVEQNPHWETDWMSDRQKAFEKAPAAKLPPRPAPDKPHYTAHTITFHKDGFHTKTKDSSPPAGTEKKRKKEKKKKSKRKQSSSSSSSSDSSSSDSDSTKKKKKKNKKEKGDEKTLNEWMSSIQSERLNDNDRKLLDTIKSRLKINKEEEKRRSPERSDRSDRSARDRERERERSIDSRKARESVRRERSRDRRESRARSRSPRSPRDPRDPRRRSSPEPAKKPEIKKMPFIGKMPVYKHLGIKPKTEEQKKEEQKKKDDEEASKKRREEMDAEIQKKVAEFKEKIARAQLERQAQVELPPPGVALPQRLAAQPLPPPTPYMPQPTPPPPVAPVAPVAPAPTLPKDFQEALDIIFPTDVKPELTQDSILGFPPQLPPGFPMLGVPPFQLPSLLNQPQMPGMFGFDLNAPLFPPRPQLYDTHVPLVPSPKPRPGRKQHDQKKYHHSQQSKPKPASSPAPAPSPAPVKAPEIKVEPKENGAPPGKNKEEMDELAMLGIDATDVGANI